MKNALFVCGKARMRSPTAAALAEQMEGVAADFAGLSFDADERISTEHIEWADIIFVMERRQQKRLTVLFGAMLRDKKVRVLDVPDKFSYMDEALISLLRPKLEAALSLK